VDTDPFALLRDVVRRSPYAWAGLATTLLSIYVVARLVTWLGLFIALRPLKGHEESHWTERARLAWPGRRLGRVSFVVVGLCLLIAYFYNFSFAEFFPRTMTRALVVIAAYVGATQSAIGWRRRFNPADGRTPRANRAAWLFNLSIVGPLMLLAFIGIGSIGDEWNAQTVGVMLGSALAFGLYFGWGWVRIMRCCGIIRPASAQLCAIVSYVAGLLDVRPKAVHQVALPMANAFAFFSTKSIGVSDAAISVLNDDELTMVCAHELAHLSEPRRVVLARLSIGFVLGSVVAIYESVIPAIKVNGPEVAVLLYAGGTVFLIVSMGLFVRMARQMEARADAIARGFETTPGTYARALEKIYAANLVPVVLGTKRVTHPDLYDRMIVAGVYPDYPRPQAPSKRPLYFGFLVMVIGSFLMSAVLRHVLKHVAHRVLGPEAAALWTMGAEGASEPELDFLWDRYQPGEGSARPFGRDEMTADPDADAASVRANPLPQSVTTH
jgi:Zn-dependent protease with chaperone function